MLAGKRSVCWRVYILQNVHLEDIGMVRCSCEMRVYLEYSYLLKLT